MLYYIYIFSSIGASIGYGISPMCFVRRNSINATVPRSITLLLISFNGFPSTLSADNFMNPKTVGSLVRELFSMFKKFSPALK